ncbi:MAG: DCC1-like thiol-disulfide oxidoreductase family protein, partial [Candidatus Nanohaloarchaea archaeon]|nr:DCC1-like thiol-disulfide oxidoreductase family protein [Candidatus Nanohaloarchaea archaeon]
MDREDFIELAGKARNIAEQKADETRTRLEDRIDDAETERATALIDTIQETLDSTDRDTLEEKADRSVAAIEEQLSSYREDPEQLQDDVDGLVDLVRGELTKDDVIDSGQVAASGVKYLLSDEDSIQPDDVSRKTVLYDGNCPVCTEFRARVEKLDWFDTVEWQDLHEYDFDADELDQGRCMKDIHVIDDDETYQGFAGVRHIAQ